MVINKDEKNAVECYLKFAERGNSYGQVGLYYDEGVGTNKDGRKQFEWST